MKSGFTEFTATRLIPDSPGKTAQEYAREYLQLGDNLSDAENPVESLANTLDKQVREGREKRVRRERVAGKYRFFPASAPSNTDPDMVKEDIVIQVSLPKQELDDLNNLIALDKFKSKSNAIAWLISEGVKANRNYLDKIANIRKQIEQMKREIEFT